ncbi:glycoside hydrolase family 76 protein [Aspergillus ibericus CBS 121593]|uniref:mannan endo-1,6-alpha-mannosidase n=1 Tax=Aspergillus ibericus CBS 121593 TaxID=1448316 RepID=A0A395GRF8_9EURO|nr:hypothetical protein BO80DRAFT_413204 [Aspergillus ibericus CBS 121593]RAK98141.1 hypothetical protein BO80DRAFT_413204 [Aspergillus ibericus CBS 121593]
MSITQLSWHALLLAGCVSAIDFNITKTDTIKTAAATQLQNLLSTADFNGTINPIYSTGYPEGMLYMSLIPYWNATKNTTYNEHIIARMHNQSDTIYSGVWEEVDVLTSEFVAWGLAAVTAAEVDFPGTPSNSSWLAYAKKVAYTLDLTIDQGSVCHGGLYDDESDEHGTQFDWFDNGAYFQLVSRIAAASSGSDQGTYAEYADSAWSWSETNGMVNTTAWSVSEMVSNKTANASSCAATSTSRWTWAYGLYLSGAAHMYQATKSEVWLNRTEGLLNSTLDTFFINDILVEVGSDSSSLGTAEQSTLSALPFKGFLALCLASVANLMPDWADRITPLLADTAVAVAEQCNGTSNHTVCGSDWGESTYNNDPSFENTWNAANVFTSKLLLPESKSTNSTSASSGKSSGATSKKKSDKGISKAVIIGAVVGCVAAVALIGAGIFFALQQRNRRVPVPIREPYAPYEPVRRMGNPAEMAQGGYRPDFDNRGFAEPYGRVDGGNVPHEMDSAETSKLVGRTYQSPYEMR